MCLFATGAGSAHNSNPETVIPLPSPVVKTKTPTPHPTTLMTPYEFVFTSLHQFPLLHSTFMLLLID